MEKIDLISYTDSTGFASEQSIEVHKIILTIMWCVVADIAVILSLYKYRVYSFYVHAVLGALIFLATLANTFIFLIPYGMNVGFGLYDTHMAIHSWLGISTIILTGIQVIVGIISRVWQKQGASSTVRVIKNKLIHQILGYFLMVIAKACLLVMWYYRNTTIFGICLGWQVILISLYIWRKFIFPKLPNRIVDKQAIQNSSIPEIADLSQMKVQNYVIFSNYVYDVQRLKYMHPGGHQIIKTMMGREIDRFIYGMYSSELLPQVHKHEHSFKSLELVGPPIAKIKIPLLYQGSMPQLMNVEIKMKEVISETTQIYCIRLYPVDGNLFRFIGYTDVRQLGHYYSLTMDDKITRLYTSVQFIRNRNIILMRKLCPQMSYLQKSYKAKSQKDSPQIQLQVTTIRETLFPKDQKFSAQDQIGDCIPLMMKKYDQGELTSKLFSQNWNGKLKMSAPKGEGLKFSSLQPGKIIIVCGGTGFFPFADIIDLLFKQKLVDQGHSCSQQILKQNPILKTKPFQGFSFLLLAAFNFPQDIHPMNLFQISELCKNNKTFRAYLRIKNQQVKIQSLYPQINCIRQRFKKILIDEARKQQLSKIWICGPPILNTETGKSLLENGFTQNDFLFI